MIIALAEAHLGQAAAAERHVAEALTLAPEDRDILMRSAKLHRAEATTPRSSACGWPSSGDILRSWLATTRNSAVLKSSPAFENAVMPARGHARAPARLP